MSNSENMNVSERLAQRLKESDLGSLLSEDDVTSIAKDAIERAFFKNREIPDGSYNTKRLPPLVTELATESFKAAIAKAIEPVVAELTENVEFKTILQQAIVAEIPKVAERFAYGLVNNAYAAANNDLTTRLNQTVGAKLGIVI